MHLLTLILSLSTLASAQFGFFDQMFGNQEEHGHQQQQQQRNNPSDAGQYRGRFEQCTIQSGKTHVFTRVITFDCFILTCLAVCDKYLCPDSLACVHFPHHCPCIWDGQEDKFELGEGKRICISKGGFKDGEAARKLELARKGLL